MTAVSIKWAAPYEGEDIHVLRGTTSAPLDQLISVDVGDGGVPYSPAGAVAAGVLIALDFFPRVLTTVEADGRYAAEGFVIDQKTGEIEANAVSGSAQRVNGFYIDIAAVPTDEPTATLTLSLMVWLHDAVVGRWLTPSILTLPRDKLDNQGRSVSPRSWRRPTVLAEFDDGVVGDVSNYPGVSWSAPPGLDNDPQQGYAAQSGTAPGVAIPVTASLPGGLGGGLAAGHVKVADAWEDLPQAERTVECLSGVGTAADADRAAANVLIMADGIPDAGEQRALAAALARRTARMPPFSWAGDRVRFWFVPLASREAGGTRRAPIYDTRTTGFPWPAAERPASSGAWKPAELLYVVGPGGPAPPGGWPSREDQISRWAGLVPYPEAELTAHVEDGPYDIWKLLSQSIALNERDTALSLVNDDRRNSDDKELGFHPQRCARAELNRFLGALVDGAGTPMGDRWTTGDDRRLIMILSGGHADLGNYRPRDEVVMMAVEDTGVAPTLQQATLTGGLDLVPVPWPTGAPVSVGTHELRGRFAHELGHALGLGDEYGGEPQLPHEVWIEDDANLAADAGPFGVVGPDGIDGELIRWNHHRVARAFPLVSSQPIGYVPASSADPPREVDGRLGYQIRIEPGELQRGLADGFDLDDGLHLVLFVRSRPAPNAALDDWVLSPPVEYVGTDLAADIVFVRDFGTDSMQGLSGFMITLDGRRNTSAGPILFAAVPKPLEPDGQARLVPKLVRDHLTDSRRPLDAPPGGTQAAWTCADGSQSRGSNWPKLTNRPAGLRKGQPFFAARRVPALWSGGHTYDCGVYHPTSHSIMRGSTSRKLPADTSPGDVYVPPDDEDLPKYGHVNEFGPVARYLLLERLAPDQHHLLEAELARRDPDR